jgi:hypothetical protein
MSNNNKNCNYYIYYEKSDGTYRCYNTETEQLETLNKLPFSIGTFHIMKGYEASDKGIMDYYTDFNKWQNELRYNKILSIRYDKYYNHRSAVELTFKRLSKNKYEHFESIEMTEHNLINKCPNGGLAYLNPDCADKLLDCYSFDFTANYPTILQSKKFKIATKPYTEYTLKKLPKRKKVKLGIYHVSITSSHPHIKRIFAFSKHNYYQDESIKFALKHSKKFNINIELIQDGKSNAFIYEEYVTGREVFGNWFDQLIQLKKKYPKNRLAKHLLSSIWGSITHMKNVNKTYEQIVEQNIDVDNDYYIHELIIKPNTEYYVLIPVTNAYTFNIRIKSLLTAFARNNIAKVVLNNIDTFVRVQTDGATFTKPIDNTKYEGFLPEAKTTGKLIWKHVNKAKNEHNVTVIG